MLPFPQDAASWAHVALGNYILPILADAPESNQSIQGRTPFLDPLFLRHCFALSPEQTGLPSSNKKPLRDFLSDQGLSHISHRPKHSFQAPPLLGSQAVRLFLVKQWQNPGYWDNTPFCPQKMKDFALGLEKTTPQQDTVLEPVVCSVLSLVSFKNAFGLNTPQF